MIPPPTNDKIFPSMSPPRFFSLFLLEAENRYYLFPLCCDIVFPHFDSGLAFFPPTPTHPFPYCSGYLRFFPTRQNFLFCCGPPPILLLSFHLKFTMYSLASDTRGIGTSPLSSLLFTNTKACKCLFSGGQPSENQCTSWWLRSFVTSPPSLLDYRSPTVWSPVP